MKVSKLELSFCAFLLVAGFSASTMYIHGEIKNKKESQEIKYKEELQNIRSKEQQRLSKMIYQLPLNKIDKQGYCRLKSESI